MMNNRVQLNEEVLETIAGGNITFDWDGTIGHCGLNGDKSYTFNSRNDFVSAVMTCYNQGLSDSECLETLIQNGVVY